MRGFNPLSVGGLLPCPALAKLPVEEEERLALVAYHFQGLDDILGVLLLLDLLRHEPLQKSLARVVVFPDRQPVKVVDHCRDLLLVLEGLLEDL